jgi:hypothetical protein
LFEIFFRGVSNIDLACREASVEPISFDALNVFCRRTVPQQMLVGTNVATSFHLEMAVLCIYCRTADFGWFEVLSQKPKDIAFYVAMLTFASLPTLFRPSSASLFRR